MTITGNTCRSLPELGEFGLIGLISRKVPAAPTVPVGIGDDAAAFQWHNGSIGLVTTDMLVEAVHFDLSFCDPVRLGRKTLAVNLSDIAAMGGNPSCFLLSLALPETISVNFIDEFTTGMLRLAAEFGVTLIGGDTCASRGGLVISVTLYGEQEPGKIVRRSGARPGDLIFVTGTLGDSALGLELLRKGHREGYCIDRHLDPSPRVREGRALAEAGLPTAMIDVSDGLLSDLGHVVRSSGVGARLHLEKIPCSQEFASLLESTANEGYALALGGGEDYELLFTAPSHRRNEIITLLSNYGTPVTEIGEITANHGIVVLSPEGEAVSILKPGYDHFRFDVPDKERQSA